MPPVGHDRIGADLQRTTGHTLELRWSDDWFCEVSIDGTLAGGIGIHVGDDDEAVVAEIADRLQEWGAR